LAVIGETVAPPRTAVKPRAAPSPVVSPG